MWFGLNLFPFRYLNYLLITYGYKEAGLVSLLFCL
nr:MAG TPA: hypothetical protein [Caudoviricetes sp.]